MGYLNNTGLSYLWSKMKLKFADINHSHTASSISAGTLAGSVVANATAASTIGSSQVRNIYAGTTDMTAGSTALPTGDLYFMYE